MDDADDADGGARDAHTVRACPWGPGVFAAAAARFAQPAAVVGPHAQPGRGARRPSPPELRERPRAAPAGAEWAAR